MRRIGLLLSFFLIEVCAVAQDATIKVRGQFLIDSIKIGKPFPYSLTAEYPSKNRILFPDSTFAFTPFEYAGKQYFPTKTVKGISRDSAVYYLNTFEIDSVQTLSLPIFVVQRQDCTTVFAERDQVWLQHLVTIATDSIQANQLPLKVNNFYEPVAWLFNYPLASIIGAVLILLVIGGWLVFGKRIIRYVKIKRMRKTFEQFLSSFTNSVEQLKINYSPTDAEKSLTLWKKYLENLEDKPFTKLTSKEILRSAGNEALETPLKTVDRLIYAGVQPSSFDAFYELKSFSEDRFYKKLDDISHPK
jgi:hypothetical protein